MKNIIALLAVLSTCLLVGCSGGGSDGGGKGGGNGGSSSSVNANVPVGELDPKAIPPSRQAEWDEYAEKFEATTVNIVSGIYNVTFTNNLGKKDIAYVYINSKDSSHPDELVITAYNYMLDDVDTEGSCYRLANGSMVNAKINGGPGLGGKGSIMKWVEPWDNSNRVSKYEIEFDGQKLYWELDRYTNITSINFGQEKSATHLIVNTDATKLSVTANKEILGQVSISNILSNICVGDPVNEATVGSTNFSGLYDVSVLEGNKKYESYLYIDATGKLFSYKYMGDGYDNSSNQNCYKPSPFYNYSLHEKGLTYDRSENKLSLSVDEMSLVWNLDQNGFVKSVGLSTGIPGDAYINQGRAISISAKLVTSISVSEIQNSICK